MKPKDIITYMKEAVRSYAPMCLLIGFAIAFGRVLVLLRAPQLISEFMVNTFSSKVTFLLALNVILLVLGMFMDTGAAIAILSPMILPTAVSMGINPIHFGIILVVKLAIGLVSQPFGINLFIAATLIDIPSIPLGKKEFKLGRAHI